ncbi:hypothetical protein ACHAXA_007932 [Cyclostephanos tholiformis]|uniref:CS domain-containing protein n=1 Tax=Cyclostephanos tholiformis TaxID=382380 RepID=A0ABD3RAM0_9STRA
MAKDSKDPKASGADEAPTVEDADADVDGVTPATDANEGAAPSAKDKATNDDATTEMSDSDDALADESGIAAAEATTTTTTTKNDDGYRGKYNWDDTTRYGKKGEKATVVPLNGAIVDYAWSDGTKSVKIYVELRGLDDLKDDDIEVSLVNEGEGFAFRAKNVGGRDRLLSIDKLYKKVKDVKLVRKAGKDKVVIKLVKDDEKRKWYNLKDGGASSSSYDDDDYDWNDGGGGDDDWIPPEDEEAMDDMLSEGKDDDPKKEEGDGVDVPMEDVAEVEALGESETAMTNE